jgi:hypothetical protein
VNTKAINSAAGVINAALTQNRTAAGIALALDSAGLLMTPETAAELASLRAQFTVSDHPVDEDPIAFALTAEAASVQPVCPVCQHPGCCCSCFGKTPRQDCTHQPAEEDVRPQVRKLRALLAVQRAVTEDPHDSPLHQTHRISRDLPATGGAS